MKRAMRVPDWAESILSLVMAHEGIEVPPKLSWVDARWIGDHQGPNSSGATAGNAIAVSPGASIRDARHTLFHELAHWATDSGHTSSMYAKLFELLWLFGEPGDLEYAREREVVYQEDASMRGWMRFATQAATWTQRAETVAERVLSSPIPRGLLSVIALILGVDSLQQIG